MNSMRKLLLVLTAVMMATFALPSIGDDLTKHFSLTMVVGAPDNTQTDTIVMATVMNDNPSGSSAQFGSLRLLVSNASGITITGGEPDPNFGGTPTLDSPTSITFTGISPVKAGQFYTAKLHVKGCGDGNIWSATVWAGSNRNGGNYVDDTPDPQTKITNVSCGLVGCAIADNSFGVGSILTQGQRARNQDNSACSLVNYFFTDLTADTSKNYVQFRSDTSQPGAAFFYVVNKPATANAQFAWTTTGGNPNFVTAGPCNNTPIATGSYGSLISDSGGKLIKIDTSTADYPVPLTLPFYIVIGPQNIVEHLKVTKVSGQTLTVERGANAYVHPASQAVLSTPLFPGTQMCLAPGAAAGTSAIFDIGDGFFKP